MRNLLFGILTIGVLTAMTIPDEYVSDLEKMKGYFNQEEFTMNLTYKVYAQTTNKLLDSKSGIFEKSGAEFYYSLEGIKIIQNDKLSVYVNEADELMAVNESRPEALKELMDLNTATEGCESVVRTESDGSYIYTFHFAKPVSEIYSQTMVYAKKSNLMPQKIVFEYAQITTQTDQSGTLIKDKLRLEMIYSEYKSESKRNFSLGEYFKQTGSDITPVGVYKNYQLIDQRNNNIK